MSGNSPRMGGAGASSGPEGPNRSPALLQRQPLGNYRPGMESIPPADLSSVIQAVVSMSDTRLGPGFDELSTNGALASSLASPTGQDGVAQRWWNALSNRKSLKPFLTIIYGSYRFLFNF